MQDGRDGQVPIGSAVPRIFGSPGKWPSSLRSVDERLARRRGSDKNKKSGQTLDRHVGCFPLFPVTCHPSPLQGSGDAAWRKEASPGRNRESISPVDEGGRVRPEPASPGRFSGGTKARKIAGFRIG